MGPIKSVLSLIPSIRLSGSGSKVAYQELPSHDMSHATSPLDESPIMSDTWRKGLSAPRRRLGSLLRASPRRLFIITLTVFFTLVLLAGGSLRARRYYVEKAKAEERIPYHWELYPR